MSDDLLPCPFCGAQPVVRNPRWTNDSMYAYCVSCDARGPYGENKKAAIVAWNRRTPTMPANVRDTIRICASYGMPLGITYAEYNAARDVALAWLDAMEGTT